jgi:biotin carboxyl carrier protein
MHEELELIVVERAGARSLAAPTVGWFTCALPKGSVVVPGGAAGFLLTLGRARALRVPADVGGVVVNAPPERLHEPVGYKTVLYELAPLAERAAADSAARGADAQLGGAAKPTVRSPSAGRFWQRPSPNEKPLVELGSVIENGTPLGLVEVMKTFTQVLYRAEHGLPPRAKIARVLVGDGAEVEEGAALFELEAI